MRLREIGRLALGTVAAQRCCADLGPKLLLASRAHCFLLTIMIVGTYWPLWRCRTHQKVEMEGASRAFLDLLSRRARVLSA